MSGVSHQGLRSWHSSMEQYRRMLVYVRSHRPCLVLAAICLISKGLLSLAMLWTVKGLVDQVVVGQDIGQLNRITFLLAGIFVLRAGLSFAQTYLTAWAGERTSSTLRREIYEYLLSLPQGFFSRQRVGEIVSRLSNDVQLIQSAVTSNLVSLLQQSATFAGLIAIVAIMNWHLMLLMAVAIPGMMLLTRLLGRRIRKIARRFQDTLGEASAAVEETVSGIRIAKPAVREDHDMARYGQKRVRTSHVWMGCTVRGG